MEFDESKAIEYIQNKIGVTIDEDEILNIIDIIWDYYEDNGFLDLSIDSCDENIDNKLLIKHVQLVIKKDKWSKISEDLVAQIVPAELEYEETLDEF